MDAQNSFRMDKKVTIISVDKTIWGAGVLALSSYLRKYGYDTNVIFLPTFCEEYSEEVLVQLTEICKGSFLISVSTMAHTSGKAFQIATYLKKLGIPLVAGGIYPTLNPEKCLDYFNYVCVGEGECALLELATCLDKNVNHANIKNIWLKRGGKVIKNKLRDLIKDINTLPFPDYDFKHQFILISDNIVQMSEKYMNKGEHNQNDPSLSKMDYFVTVHSIRGCSHNCRYCCNYDLKILYKKCQHYTRIKCVKNLISELKKIKKEIPKLRFIWFTDDDFLIRDLDSIKRFSKKYTGDIGLPFMCYITPTSIDEIKLNELLVAGLRRVMVGIQSGSANTRFNVYNRLISNDIILHKAKILSRRLIFKIFPPEYQVINTTPFETEEDCFETLKLLYMLPRPYYLEVFNLIFFPGSRFAKKYNFNDWETYTLNYIDQVSHFKKKRATPHHILIGLLKGKWNMYKCGRIPSPFLKFLLKDKKRIQKFSFIIRLLNRIPSRRKIFFSLPLPYKRIYYKIDLFLIRVYGKYYAGYVGKYLRKYYFKTQRYFSKLRYVLKATKSLCPICLNEIDAFIYKMGKEVYMRKTCPDHGTFDELIENYKSYKQIGKNI